MGERTILITGGAGFIGSALVAACVERGDQVVVFDKLTYAGHRQNLEWIKGGWTLIEGDVADANAVAKLFQNYNFDAVIHAAAESHVDNSIAGAAPFVRTNIVGTQVLLDASLAHDKRRAADFRYVQISTDEVYGALGREGAFATDSPMAPNSPYAASKASADMLVRAWHKTYGLPTLITRCCNNYGPRQHPEKLIPHMITKALAGEHLPVYGDGNQRREWIHVEDHARGVLEVLEKGTPGNVYHLGSEAEQRNLDLVHLLCGLLQKKTGKDHRKQITHVADRLGHDFRYALSDSFVKPRIEFAEGIKHTVQWYLDNEKWIATMRAHGVKFK